jgi:PAS domain S-box-containing protein
MKIAVNKKSRLGKDERKNKARLSEELRAARRKIASLECTKDALKLGEELYRLFFDNSGEAILLGQPDGTISSANLEACRLFGRSENEIIKLGRAGIVDSKDPRIPAAIEERRRTGQFKGELNHIKKDGLVFPCDVTTKTFRDSSGNERSITILRDLTNRKREKEALIKSESNLRALAMKLSRAEERERQRLALFLHDEIGQTLALLRMKFGSFAGAWRSKSRKQSIQQIRNLLEKVIYQAHTLTFELSPPILHQLGLEAAVEWAGENIGHDYGIDFTFNDDGSNKPLDTDLKTLVFGCVRELMINTAKHAKAKRLSVSIAREGEQILMTINDDGIGFDFSLQERQSNLAGFGLFSIRERLTSIGGTFELRSEPGRGTRVTLSVPSKEVIPSSGVS